MLIKAAKAYHGGHAPAPHVCVNPESARLIAFAVAVGLSLAACSEPKPPEQQVAKSEPAPQAATAPPAPKTDIKLIRDGIGVGGIELGMTAGDVEARLGKPDRINKAGDQPVFMAFFEPQNFGVYFGDDGRVRLLIVSLRDGSVCTAYDACLYREGDLAKLKAHHGDKLLRFTDRDGSVTYRMLEAKGDRKVMTEYTPAEDRNGIVQVAIFYWNGPIDQSSFD